jgi:lipoyl(octanoyl) transferase
VAQYDNSCWVVDLGRIPYVRACELQRRLVEARKARAVPDILLLCEHNHVITLGRNGKREHLRASLHVLDQMNVEFLPTDRGGDITYHGPGQIVGYPILDLTEHRRDVRWYAWQLEETMIRATVDFGIAAERLEGMRGVWIDGSTGPEKVGALGVHLSRWVTSHGFAFNVSTDLRFFDLIVPCGITDKRATSLEKALGRALDCDEVRPLLAAHFGDIFGRAMVSISSRQMEEVLLGSDASTALIPDAPMLCSPPLEGRFLPTAGKIAVAERELAKY